MAEVTATKVCTKCGLVKSLDAFYVRRASADGRSARCAECGKQASAAYRAANPERVAEAWARWSAEHPGASAVRAKRWRQENPERFAEGRARWARENAEYLALLKRAYYLANEDRLKALRDPVRSREANHRYRESHRLERLAAENLRRARKAMTQIGDVDLAALWTGACGLCAEPLDIAPRWPDPMSKSLDHIVPLSKGGSHSQDNLQWTHLRCNIRKGARLVA